LKSTTFTADIIAASLFTVRGAISCNGLSVGEPWVRGDGEPVGGGGGGGKGRRRWELGASPALNDGDHDISKASMLGSTNHTHPRPLLLQHHLHCTNQFRVPLRVDALRLVQSSRRVSVHVAADAMIRSQFLSDSLTWQ
jgi:hypothetical protein